MNSINITITSYSDQPGLVAEIWCELGMLAAIRRQGDKSSFTIEFFPIAGDKRPTFDLGSMEAEIVKAKRRLLEIEGLQPAKTA